MEQILAKPEWLKIRINANDNFSGIKQALQEHKLHTVCESAHCPNISECWNSGTATFMLMGDVCTRGCRFCAVKTGNPMKQLDRDEPRKLAAALKEIKLFDYVVLTSVNRDDLKDGGAGHFAECIREIKKEYPKMIIEVLIPDFNGSLGSLKKITDAKPDVIAHNIETVERLQRKARDIRANYGQSLNVLKNAKKINPKIFTKSSIMAGIGERDDEVIKAMKDLREIGVDILTIGQYLRPTDRHLPVMQFISPEKFRYYERKGLELGFRFVAAGPFVRSSYKAGELFLKNIINKSQ
ncbi:lipoyl synthase [Candidatus Woesearchaeota archaeon]|nr:lipoyl synthase [Candidatus Woesearchaeota archaeon]MBI2661341.1 lipoyl synthase [Candidatus Woesearchaeota archaeon]